MAWTKEIPANPVVAVAGATGAVGREFLEVLHDLDFPASEVRALASSRSTGKKLPFKGCGQVPAGDLIVEEMTPASFEGVDIALFSAGAGRCCRCGHDRQLERFSHGRGCAARGARSEPGRCGVAQWRDRESELLDHPDGGCSKAAL